MDGTENFMATKKKRIGKAQRQLRVQRVVRMRQDFQYLYDRLSHLLYIWDNPESVQAGFGPGETMTMLADDLPVFKAKYKLTDCYERKHPNAELSDSRRAAPTTAQKRYE